MMKYPNGCNVCGYNPCRCHTNSCCTTSPVVCQPGVPTHPIAPPTVTIESLLKLITSKCDKETCKILQFEIDYLYWLMSLQKPGNGGGGTKPPVGGNPGIPGTNPPTTGPDIPKCPDGTYNCHPPCKDGTWDCYPHNPPHFPDAKLFQLVQNMVDKLDGDLTDKYPSAKLLKEELMFLWKCMANKHQHHGEWKDNWTYRDVVQTTDHCLFEQGKDPAPGKIKVITPVDIGSTVFHTIKDKNGKDKRCLFESLVDKNIVEPSKLAVLDGLWLNYCDLKAVIDCVIPRTKITDCKQKCDDPNGDGVKEERTLCEIVKGDRIKDYKQLPDGSYVITLVDGTVFHAPGADVHLSKDGKSIVKLAGNKWIKNQVTAWIAFGEKGNIWDSYNISHLVHTRRGYWRAFFKVLMDNNNYGTASDSDASQYWSSTDQHHFDSSQIMVVDNREAPQDDNVYVIWFGGKD